MSWVEDWSKVDALREKLKRCGLSDLIYIPERKNMLLKKIICCARCGQDHINVVAKPLTQPVYEDAPSEAILYTHWAPCPNNGEPILVVELSSGSKMTVDTDEGA